MKYGVYKMKNLIKKFGTSEHMTCFFGKESKFEGIIKFHGTARIDGRSKGKIWGEGTLSIGREAKIESEIHASSVINSGEIHGNIYAEKEIELHAPGKVYGNVEAPTIEIEKGVVFEGTSWQRKPKLTDDEKLEIKNALNKLKDI